MITELSGRARMMKQLMMVALVSLLFGCGGGDNAFYGEQTGSVATDSTTYTLTASAITTTVVVIAEAVSV